MVNTREIELSCGAKAVVTSVPSMLVLGILEAHQAPRPPVITLDNGRQEENPNDPEYARQVSQHQTLTGRLTNEAYLAQGVVRVYDLPEGKYSLDDDAWIELAEIVGVPVRHEGLGRKIDWLQYHIMSDGDLGDIISGIAVAGGGVTEAMVKKAADSFRTEQDGPALTLVSSETEVRLGDQTAGDSRDSN